MADTLDIKLGRPGGGLTPMSVDFSIVADLLQGLETAVVTEAGIDRLRYPDSKMRGKSLPFHNLSVLKVGQGVGPDGQPTAEYDCAVGPELVVPVSRITAALAGTAIVPLTSEAAEQTKKCLERVIRLGLSVQLVNGVHTPVFQQSHPVPDLLTTNERRVTSEIAVRIIRVGGKHRATAVVELLTTGEQVTANLGRNRKRAKELANHLYGDAMLQGEAVWEIDTQNFGAPKRLLKFEVTGHRLLESVPLPVLFDELAQATGGAWDHIDVTLYEGDAETQP
jgi:hypothetical protein